MLSRRHFLQSSAAAAPFVFSRDVSAVAASDRIAVGFIGVGYQARGHLNNLLGRKEVEVVAVCDVVKERLDDAAQRVEKRYADRIKSGAAKSATAYTDFRKLLDHSGLDAVVIGTPDHWHAMPVILAARAKKHIYCEKPLTHNIAEGKRIVQEVAKGNIIFQTGSQQRSEFGGHFRKAVEYVWNGRIGKLHTIRIGVGGPSRPCKLPAESTPPGTDWDAWLGPAPERPFNEVLCPKGVHSHFPDWRSYQEFAGGQVADMGAHHFDIAQWAMKMDGSGPVQVIPPEKSQRPRSPLHLRQRHRHDPQRIREGAGRQGPACRLRIRRDGRHDPGEPRRHPQFAGRDSEGADRRKGRSAFTRRTTTSATG